MTRLLESGSSVRHRRDFLKLAGGAVVLSMLPDEARADVMCQDSWNGRVCSSGIASELLDIPAVEDEDEQRQSQWCWAASIAMIFAYFGHPVSQERIVHEAYGGLVNWPAVPQTILAQLNRPWIDDNGVPFSARSGNGISNPVLMAQDLAQDLPLIVGTRQHAMVMTAMEYFAPWIMTPYGPMLGPVSVTGATVRDPWPGRGKRLLQADEWLGIMFVAHIRVW